jgi:hypothetical protein
MYKIVGKQNLYAVNEVAERAMIIMHNHSESEAEIAEVPLDVLISLASGYLFLYNAVL